MDRPFDVFLSYAHVDRDRVEPIERALRAAGLQVWRDEPEIELFCSISSAVTTALARSKVLLAYYSKTYPRRRACQWELTAAFIAAQSEGDVRRRICVVNPEADATHVEPVELREARFVQGFDASDGPMGDLASAVALKVRSVERSFGEIRFRAPPWYGFRGVGSNRFTGRASDLWHLHSALIQSEYPVVTGDTAPGQVQVRGMGGIGKSLLVEEYALRFGAAYPGGVFWLQAGGADVAVDTAMCERARREHIRLFADALGVVSAGLTDGELESSLSRALARLGERYLWVVDDLPELLTERDRRAWLAPTVDLGKTVITTRDRSRGRVGHIIDLDVLDPDSAYELLTSRKTPADAQEAVAARALAADLGCHALALDIAAGALEALAETEGFAAFRASLADPHIDVLPSWQELGDQLPDGQQRNVVATLLRGYDLLDDAARDFLRLASMLAAEAIPGDLLDAVFRGLGASSPYAGVKAADGAAKHSFARRAASRGWTVHALVARAACRQDPLPERRAAMRGVALRALTQMIDTPAHDQDATKLHLHVAHARRLIEGSTTTIDEARLLAVVGAFDQHCGAYASAERLQTRAIGLATRCLGGTERETMRMSRALGWTLFAGGRWRDARAILVEVIAAQTREFGETDPETLASRHDLGYVLTSLGELDEALEVFEAVTEWRRRVAGPEAEETLASLNGLGAVLRALSKLDRARAIEEDILAIRERLLGPEHSDTIWAANELAETLRTLGTPHLSAALLLGQRVLSGWTTRHGEEHPKTLTAMCNLAFTLWELGGAEQVQAARRLEEKVVVLRSGVLGEEHPDTLLAINNLGSTRRRQGDAAGARALHERALAGRTRILGANHLDTLTSMNNLGLVLAGESELARARALQERCLQGRTALLNEGHPEILKAASNLLTTLLLVGDRPAAQSIAAAFIRPLSRRPAESLSGVESEIRAMWEDVLDL